MLNGQFISEQFTSQVKAADNNDDIIKPYFIGNLSISKKIGKYVEIYGQLNNFLNVDYEIWKGYNAPNLNGWGGIKVFW
jgi:outer membrane cobalamin receptor